MAEKGFEQYKSNDTLSVFDVLARRNNDMITIISVGQDMQPMWLRFYALAWAGCYVKGESDKILRRWTFAGEGQRAIGGTPGNLEWGPSIEVKGSFVEGQAGVVIEIIGQ